MKRIITAVTALALSLSLAACSATESKPATEEKKTVAVEVTDAEGKKVSVDFPSMPERVAVLNYQTLDFLDAMGLGDRVVGAVKSNLPEHLKKYAENENIVDIGGMKDPDMEAIASLKPDVIFSSDRTESMYDQFSKIAPTMASYINYKEGFMESYKNLASKHAQIFGVSDKLNETIEGYEKRISAMNEKFNGKTAMLGIFAGGLNTLGSNGRCSILVNEMGFKNLTDADVNHGNKSSYEVVLELNPEYVFVLDKDTAVGSEAVDAKKHMDNDIIKETTAYKNNKIIYLEPGDAWYTCDGGILAMDLMLKNLEENLNM